MQREYLQLATALGGEAIDISSCEAAKLMEYDTILAGAPTWYNATVSCDNLNQIINPHV